MADNHQLADGGEDIFVYTGGGVPRDIKRVRICESIDTVPRNAFRECRQLIEVKGHNKLKKIERYAFYDCPSLIRITKMNGVIEIEQQAFDSCSSLSVLELDKLEIIRVGAFAFCRSLTFISLSSVRRVENAAFYKCQALTDVEFGKDLEVVMIAFRQCTSLRRIAIPLKDGLIIEDDAFMLCENLSKVDIVGAELHETISSLHMESWRDEMMEKIERINQTLPDAQYAEMTAAIQQWIRSVLNKMEYYTTEHKVLVKEAMTLLELALWKVNLDENERNGVTTSCEGVRVTRRQVKRARKERCITSGAGIIIKNVLPFLELK